MINCEVFIKDVVQFLKAKNKEIRKFDEAIKEIIEKI